MFDRPLRYEASNVALKLFSLIMSISRGGCLLFCLSGWLSVYLPVYLSVFRWDVVSGTQSIPFSTPTGAMLSVMASLLL